MPGMLQTGPAQKNNRQPKRRNRNPGSRMKGRNRNRTLTELQSATNRLPTQKLTKKWRNQRSPEATEEIIVTGSRIRRDAFTSALPVTVITSESATLAGMANTSEILQTSALASGVQIDNTFGGFVVSGGPGVNTFGLRSLDPGRTLILVNGRRFTPAGTRGQVNSVDLNSIPDVAIDRIEILKDGASSIYGADAIAGVVNIITRKRFDDVILEGYYQDELDYGSVSGLFGKTWDRGYIDAAVEFSTLGPVGRDEQDYSFCDERPLTDGGIHPSTFCAHARPLLRRGIRFRGRVRTRSGALPGTRSRRRPCRDRPSLARAWPDRRRRTSAGRRIPGRPQLGRGGPDTGSPAHPGIQ